MADPISPSSELLTLAAFAFQSSTLLYQLIDSLHSNQRPVRELSEELKALNRVLESVQETATNADTDLQILKLPLLRCGKVCKDFEALIVQRTENSGGHRTSFRHWANLRYMGEDINGFKNLLAGYKCTIDIALNDANIRRRVIIANGNNTYKEAVANATADLEEHLQWIDEKLKCLTYVSGNDMCDGEQCRLSFGTQKDPLQSGNLKVPSTSSSVLISIPSTRLRSVGTSLGQFAEAEFTHTEYGSCKIVPFTTVKQLGHGSLGMVDAVRRNGDDLGTLMARKVIDIPKILRSRLLPLIQREVAVLRGLKHRHIVRVLSTYETTSAPWQYGMLLLPVGDQDLSHFLERVGETDFPKEDLYRLKSWPSCLASVVAYIHSQSIRHRDIKPSNIICKGDEVLLTDFGSAHQFSADLTSSTEGDAVGFTRMYCAPEVIAFDRRGRSADIYSLGCVFAEIFTVASRRKIEDFNDFRSESIPGEPDRKTYAYHATAHKLEAWFAMQDEAWPFSLVSKMIVDDPKARLTASDLKTLVCNSTSCECDCSALA